MEVVGLSPMMMRLQSVTTLDAKAAPQFSTVPAPVLSCSWRRSKALNANNGNGKDALKLSLPQVQNSTAFPEASLRGKRSVLNCTASSPSQSSSASYDEEDVASGMQAEGQFLAENGEKKDKSIKGFKSSWTAKDAEGKDYLYRLGAEADNMNITVGAKAGLIDDLFAGSFLGLEAPMIPPSKRPLDI